ncbi:helix-turn-helix transcriptional regulator [Paenibacillus sp. 1P03SA]|uniref:helix-turn-helix transcriptional regulator n=1 Tax=Paenibacillus sp. 1P03SA TaxID=3132294 RepID=UPI0039A3166F
MKNNLQFLMESRNVTVSMLAKELNVSRTTIYRLLEGKTPSAILMLKISAYFKKPVNDVFCA